MTTRKNHTLWTPGIIAILCACLPGVTDQQPQVDDASARTMTVGAGTSENPVVRSPVHPSAPEAVADEKPAYIDGEIMVAVRSGADADQVAQRHGARLLRQPGPAGYALVSIPEGRDSKSFMAELLQDSEIKDAAPNGIIEGAGSSKVDHQWHLDAIGLDGAPSDDFASVLVAVLDSGVAYENYKDSLKYKEAKSLKDTDFYAPYDFVSHDAHANDDHQHGTHIATTIAGDDWIDGVAPGASLMPVKVLDRDNMGTEVGLLDGLAWALSHGADVVNMSLAFSPAYAPSRALQEALAEMSDAGIVMVAAAGNEGQRFLAQPAANPHVISVGATQMRSDLDLEAAPYSNLSPAIDIMAPGGSLTSDFDHDRYADGILAETFTLNNPNARTATLMSGTSQAAAIVSGAVVRLLAAGAQPEDVRFFLQASADSSLLADSDQPFVDGKGAGNLDIGAALDLVDEGAPEAERFHVGILPYLIWDDTESFHPEARLMVMDDQGNLASGVTLAGTVWAADNSFFSCEAVAGVCVVAGDSMDAFDAQGAMLPLAWAFSVDAVIVDGISHRPGAMILAGPCFEQMVQAMESDPDLADSALAFWWEGGSDAALGEVAEAGVAMNLGTGLATSPFTLIFTPSMLGTSAEAATMALPEETASQCPDSALDIMKIDMGSGLATSPFTVIRTGLGGSGLASSPFTFTLLKTSTDGLGLASSPFTNILRVDLSGTGLASSPFTLAPPVSTLSANDLAAPIVLHDAQDPIQANRLVGTELGGTMVGAVLQAGGWVAVDGRSAASGLAGSSLETLMEGESLSETPIDVEQLD